MTDSAITDIEERATALDINNSFCVQAPAGSGKTELLTQRILKLLTLAERPEEILAFTFTRKAAAEMRSRLLQSLTSASTRSAEDIAALAPHAQLTQQLASQVLAQDKAKGWHLLANTQRLRITTIDAFNAYITSQLPITSEFGAQPAISTDMEPIFQKAIQQVLAYLDDKTSIAGDIATLLQHLDNNLERLQKLLCNLLFNRDHWLSHVLQIKSDPEQARTLLSNNLDELTEENLLYACDLLQTFSAQIAKLLNFAAHNLDQAGDSSLLEHGFGSGLPEVSATVTQKWITLANFFLTSSGSLRKSVTVKNGFPAPSSSKDSSDKESFKEHKLLFAELHQSFSDDPEIHRLFHLLQQLPNGGYGEEQWLAISALTTILPFLVAHLDLELKNQGIVDYVKVSSAALDALGTEDQPTDLTMRLDYQFKHILVDEFQDTSSQQSKLLEKLTWGWQAGDGRTLFIVGDGMQSCYGFRNANVGLFLSARDNGIGSTFLKSLQLKTNFRSEASVVDWVNRVFSKAFPAQDDISRGAVSYSNSHSIRPNSSNSGVETRLWVSPKEADVSRRQQLLIEADAVVTQIDEIQSQNPESTIAILVRTRSHLAEIVPALRHAGIAWNASDIDSLTSYTEIMDMLTLFKALVNLADRTAWLALLRTPFIGLALADIHQLACKAKTDKSTLWQALTQFESLTLLSDDGKQRLQRCLPLLQNSRNQRQQNPLRDWLEAIWLLLGGPATLSADTELANIETFLQILAEASSHGDIVDIHRFESQLSSVYVSGTQKPEVNLHIMTIHNAKGLEFDYVILPGLERTTRSNDNPLLIWKEHLNARGEEKLLLSLLNKKGDLPDPNYQYLKYEAGIREQMENTRLLYIAITRAANKAILLAQVKSNKDKLSSPPKASLLATIWPQLENPGPGVIVDITDIEEELNLDEPQAPVSTIATDKTSEFISLRRVKSTWKNVAPPVPSTNDEAEPLPPLMTEYPHHHLVERRIGDIIHYCLQMLVEDKLNLTHSNTLMKLQDNWRNLLKPVCPNQDQLTEALTIIQQNLENCIAHPQADWLFKQAHTDSLCEFALSDYRYSYRKEFIIDRTFIDAEGVRWIVDYKSSRKPANEDIQSFLSQQAEQYQPQLENYAKLLAEVEDRQVNTALFFTSIPHWLPLASFNKNNM